LLLLSCALAALFAAAVALLHAVLFGIPVTIVADPEPHVTVLVMDLFELQNYDLSKSGYVSRIRIRNWIHFYIEKYSVTIYSHFEKDLLKYYFLFENMCQNFTFIM
jgi:hypothetical protein